MGGGNHAEHLLGEQPSRRAPRRSGAAAAAMGGAPVAYWSLCSSGVSGGGDVDSVTDAARPRADDDVGRYGAAASVYRGGHRTTAQLGCEKGGVSTAAAAEKGRLGHPTCEHTPSRGDGGQWKP